MLATVEESKAEERTEKVHEPEYESRAFRTDGEAIACTNSLRDDSFDNKKAHESKGHNL